MQQEQCKDDCNVNQDVECPLEQQVVTEQTLYPDKTPIGQQTWLDFKQTAKLAKNGSICEACIVKNKLVVQTSGVNANDRSQQCEPIKDVFLEEGMSVPALCEAW